MLGYKNRDKECIRCYKYSAYLPIKKDNHFEHIKIHAKATAVHK